jgi:superfamily II DNA/RNA helicase
MADDQRELYEFICDLQDPEEPPLPGLSTIKRMAAGYPASIVHSAIHGKSQLARLLVEELGADYLESVSSVKARGLQEYLEPLVLGQGAKALVFSFFGPSILPLLKRDLEQRKIKVYTTHGGLSLAEVDRQRGMFKADREACVLLSSDAGARGINIPQATYVTEYEGALTFANRTQRINRVHRIDSDAPSVTAMTFIVRHSVEAALADACMDRNDQHDTLLAQDILTAEQSTEAIENYVTAAERRSALEIYRNPRKRLHQPKERSA